MFTIRPARRTVRPTAQRIAVTLMTIGSAAALAGPAQAYDRGTCNDLFSSDNIESVDSIRMNTGSVGEVDFGDNAHLGGDAQGTAVVCWNKNGRVAVKGRLFADPAVGSVTPGIGIQYYNNGAIVVNELRWEGSKTYVGVWSPPSWVIDHHPASATYDKVRIRLFNGSTVVATNYEYR